MANPRENVGALRALSLTPPPRPPVVVDPPTPVPDAEPADRKETTDGRDPGREQPAPLSPEPDPGGTSERADPPTDGRGSGNGDAPTDAPKAEQETGPTARTSARRRRGSKVAAPSSGRRDKVTTFYLSTTHRDLLVRRREERRISQADLVLEAIRDHYETFKKDVQAPAQAPDPLGLPAPRRPRRRLADGVGVGVQFRFTVEEHAALERLAADLGVSISEMVDTCLGASATSSPSS